MKLDAIKISWVDITIIALLIVGVFRGRKRGLSVELLDLIMWLAIVVGAGFLYEPGGKMLAQLSVFSLLFSYITVYILAAITIAIFFAVLKRALGSKLAGSDAFGRGEYYLGMVAGMLRFACIVMVVMALLNSRLYNFEEVQAREQSQENNFGTIRFFRLYSLQADVFKDSWAGRLTHDYLGIVLIKPTRPEEKSLGNDNAVARRRERGVNEILDKK
jgi:membrane protein required for colicin V production